MAERKILTEHLDVPGIETLEVYVAHGGYAAARKALTEMTPAEVEAEVKTSGLRGRGGAAFPTGVKWGFIPRDTGKPIYLTVNADESEPGTCKDRVILQHLPHLLLEGILCTSYAIGCHRAFVYIRGEYLEPYEALNRAAGEARAGGYLGENLFGTGFDLDLCIHRGAGAYICGEETALLSSLAGERGEPRAKPPFPAVSGLYGCPTCINNVETVATIPCIVKNGGAWYASIGTEKSTGTRLFGVSGHVNRPGVYELELGTPFRELLEDCAGGIREGRQLKALIPGGSSMPMVPAEVAWEMNTDMESIQAHGSLGGSAGVIVMDETTSIPHVTLRLAQFYAHESCGKCTPCREGTRWMVNLLRRICSGEGTARDLDLLEQVAFNIGGPLMSGAGRTFCLLGDSAAWPVQGALKHFRHEFEALVK
jgi:NADH-quinone oxidoreductase subunit F